MDREKVIKQLELIRDYDPMLRVHHDDVFKQYAIDALELLKAQEPRVMTLEEAKGAEYCWLEQKSSKYIVIVDFVMSHSRVTGKTASEIRRLGNSRVYLLLDEEYGKDWRCWTSRPTDEQREAVKWE